MLHRTLFICNAIEKCKETTNCCVHKTPHIKDERCVPRECRYAPGVERIDCDPYDPEHPRAPVIELVGPAKTVEQKMKEVAKPVAQPVQPVTETPLEQKPLPSQLPTEYKEGPKTEVAKDAGETPVPQEETIKEAVKKKAQKKVQGKKKVQ